MRPRTGGIDEDHTRAPPRRSAGWGLGDERLHPQARRPDAGPAPRRGEAGGRRARRRVLRSPVARLPGRLRRVSRARPLRRRPGGGLCDLGRRRRVLGGRRACPGADGRHDPSRGRVEAQPAPGTRRGANSGHRGRAGGCLRAPGGLPAGGAVMSGATTEPVAPAAAEPRVVSGGETLWFLGTLARFKLEGRHTGGRFALWEGVLPHGAAPPLHSHPEDETFYILEGELTAWLVEPEHADDRSDRPVWVNTGRRCGVGDVVFAPGGAPHTFRVESDTARMLV